MQTGRPLSRSTTVKAKLNGRVMRVEKIQINSSAILVILMVNLRRKGFTMALYWSMAMSTRLEDDAVAYSSKPSSFDHCSENKRISNNSQEKDERITKQFKKFER